MSLPPDLDLTTVSDTYLTAMIDDFDKQMEELQRQMYNLRDKKLDMDIERQTLRRELIKRYHERKNWPIDYIELDRFEWHLLRRAASAEGVTRHGGGSKYVTNYSPPGIIEHMKEEFDLVYYDRDADLWRATQKGLEFLETKQQEE